MYTNGYDCFVLLCWITPLHLLFSVLSPESRQGQAPFCQVTENQTLYKYHSIFQLSAFGILYIVLHQNKLCTKHILRCINY